MNRRNFIKTTGIGLPSLIFIPSIMLNKYPILSKLYTIREVIIPEKDLWFSKGWNSEQFTISSMTYSDRFKPYRFLFPCLSNIEEELDILKKWVKEGTAQKEKYLHIYRKELDLKNGSTMISSVDDWKIAKRNDWKIIKEK